MKRILAADIGGTHSRFAQFEADDQGCLTMSDRTWLKTHEAGSFKELLNNLEQSTPLRPLKSFDTAVFAVPGPVEKKSFAHLANVPWSIDVSPLRGKQGPAEVLLINDYVAQAYACRSSAADEFKVVQPGRVDPDATLAVIGAGTGLGHACLMPDETGGFTALASEAGQAVFGFYGDRELEYQRFLLKETGAPYPFGDLVVTGLGLSKVHHFLTGEDLAAEEVAARIGPDSETTAWFSRFYGRAARNFALTVVALGGVYITGGVSARCPFLVTNDHFRNEFSKAPAYGGMLERLPVFLNVNQDLGLWGAAFYGLLHLGFRVTPSVNRDSGRSS